MSDNLTSKTISGLKWSYISTISTSVMQIGYTAVMARLLAPQAFGLVAMGGIVLRFGSYFAQMGMGQALVQKKTISNDDIRSIFTATAILGFIFFAIFVVLSPLTTIIFNDREVIPVVRFLSISFLLTGLSTTSINLLRRNFRFKALALIDIISYIIGYGIGGVFLAYKGYGVWSLVSASLLQSLISVILYYAATRHNVIFLFNWLVFKPLLSFGGKVSIIGFIEFLSSNFDTLFIGRAFGAISLGIYNRAFMLVNLPMQYFTSSLSRVLLPSFSRIQDNPSKLKKVYLPIISVVAFFLIPFCIFISINARHVILVILGNKWLEAEPILRILALITPLNLLSHFAALLCEATAVLNIKIYIQLIHLIFLAVLCYLLSFMGNMGIAYAVLIAELFRYLFYQYVLKRVLAINLYEYIKSYTPGIVTAVLMGMVNYLLLVYGIKSNSNTVWMFLISLIFSGILFVVLFFSGVSKTIRYEVKNRVIDLSQGNRIFNFLIAKL